MPGSYHTTLPLYSSPRGSPGPPATTSLWEGGCHLPPSSCLTYLRTRLLPLPAVVPLCRSLCLPAPASSPGFHPACNFCLPVTCPPACTLTLFYRFLCTSALEVLGHLSCLRSACLLGSLFCSACHLGGQTPLVPACHCSSHLGLPAAGPDSTCKSCPPGACNTCWDTCHLPATCHCLPAPCRLSACLPAPACLPLTLPAAWEGGMHCRIDPALTSLLGSSALFTALCTHIRFSTCLTTTIPLYSPL